MKSKIRVNKSDNTTIVEYFKVKKPFEFRYKLLSAIIKPYDDAVMFINTNSRVNIPEKRMEAYFDENDIEYSMFKINAIERTMFGLSLNIFKKSKPKLTEKFIIAKINPQMFTEDFFNNCISTYDVALGFESKLTIQEMSDNYRENVVDLYFDKEYFKEFLYDSIIFSSFRSTIDAANIIAECEK